MGGGSEARGAEAVAAAGGAVEGVGFEELDASDGGDDELGDAEGVGDLEGDAGEVDEGDEDLAAVVGIDGPG